MPAGRADTPMGWQRPPMRAGRILPLGWRHFLLQLAIFASFDLAYELTRSLVTGDAGLARRHAIAVVHAEQRFDLFHELAIQRWMLHAPSAVEWIANWTYFNCQFTISFLFVLWAYLFRTRAYFRIRNV